MTKIIGHRGASGVALENSPTSIKAALALPLFAVEIDIRRTQDGQLVILHDANTARVAKKRVWVERTPLSKLLKIKLKNNENILTLEEVLKMAGDKMAIMLDIKSSGTVDETIRLLKKHPKTQAIFSGRQYSDLKKLHQAVPSAKFLIQHHYDPMEVIHRAKRMGAHGICLNMWLMNPITYRLARRRKLEVYVYTINHRWLKNFFQRFYPDCVLISDHPERLL